MKNQKDPRDSLHHGGWMMKIISWFLLVILMFFLPNEIISFYGRQYFPLKVLSKPCIAVFLFIFHCLEMMMIINFILNFWTQRNFWTRYCDRNSIGCPIQHILIIRYDIYFTVFWRFCGDSFSLSLFLWTASGAPSDK